MNYKNHVLALAIIISSVSGSYILGKSLENIKKERYVEVKGLAEREVKADSSIWAIPISVVSESLPEAQMKLKGDISKIISFLNKYSLFEDEVLTRSPKVYDKLTQQYSYSPEAIKKPRYTIEEELIIRSEKVDDVMKASQNIGDLLNEGVIIAINQGPRFFFTRLNEIKPGMVADSIRQAGKAAEEFATISKSRVGKIKKATQGRFSIVAREATGAPDQYNYATDEMSFINKTVRVISTVEYYLED